MGSVNRQTILGNLGADPEIRYTEDGKPICNLRVAASYGDETEWFRVVVFGKQAESCAQYLKKGRQVYIEGRTRTREWEGKDGSKRRTTEVVAFQVVFTSGGERDEPRDAYDDGEF